MNDDTSTQLGIARSQLNEQPGRRFVIHRDGMWQIDVPYECHVDDMVALMPAQYAAFDEFPFCGVDEISNIAQEGYIASMIVTYKGLSVARSEPVYELIRSTQQEPLESNRLFANVSETELKKINDYLSGNAGAAASAAISTLSENATALLKRKVRGQTDYLAPGSTWRVSYLSQSPLSGVDVDAVGFIVNPPGTPPTPAGCTWISLGAEQVREGGVYRMGSDYRLSAAGGWDDYIYTLHSTPLPGSPDSL